MPIPIKAFKCQFKCRKPAIQIEKAMARHESICLCNPDRRTCRTCKHDSFVPFERDTGYGGHNECALDAVPTGKQMAVLCPKWEAR